MSKRYTIREVYDDNGATVGYSVWDTYNHRIANRLDGTPATYTHNEKAYEWASKRAASCNTYGEEYKPNKGRPPREYTRSLNQIQREVAPKPIDAARAPKAPTRTAAKAEIDPIAVQTAVEAAVTVKFNTVQETLLEWVEERAKEQLNGIEQRIDQTAVRKIREAGELITTDLIKKVAEAEQRIIDAKHITITNERGTKTLEESTHIRFDALLRAVVAGVNPMLVGPAGSGKTWAAEQVAKVLELPFYFIPVNSQSTKTDFVGFIDAAGNYRDTMFRRAYEKGGVFLVDEIDAGNANVLMVLNAALAGHACAFPDVMVKKHKDFIAISAANTFGTGASRQYVGRNQLDAATLDRFAMMEWPIDEVLEGNLVKGYEHGPTWHGAVKAARKIVNDSGWRVVVSPRATLKGAALLAQGFTVAEVVDMTITATADASQAPTLKKAATDAYNHASNLTEKPAPTEYNITWLDTPIRRY